MPGFRALLAVFVVGLLAFEAGAQTPADENDPHPHHGEELLVLDPPADYLQHLPDLGLEILDVTDLPGIGSKLYHLRILDGAHPFEARDKHETKFANVLVDAHHHFEHHKAKIDKGYTPRAATNWQKAPSSCGKGLRIGIVDNMLDQKHPAFKGVKIKHRSFHLKARNWRGPVTEPPSPRLLWDAWHLPGAEIVHANVFHRGKKGKAVGSAKSILRAIDWMIHQKVSVINFSIGGGKNKLVAKAIDHAAELGTIMVASSGNRGPFSKKKSYPGAYKPVIAVTAVDRFERSAKFAKALNYIDFAAPGIGIWTAVPGGGKAMSGTSFAVPFHDGLGRGGSKKARPQDNGCRTGLFPQTYEGPRQAWPRPLYGLEDPAAAPALLIKV